MGIFNELNFFVFNMGKGSRIESELFIFKWKTLQQLSKLHLFNFLRHQCSLNDIFQQLIRESDLLYLKDTLVLPPPHYRLHRNYSGAKAVRLGSHCFNFQINFKSIRLCSVEGIRGRVGPNVFRETLFRYKFLPEKQHFVKDFFATFSRKRDKIFDKLEKPNVFVSTLLQGKGEEQRMCVIEKQ